MKKKKIFIPMLEIFMQLEKVLLLPFSLRVKDQSTDFFVCVGSSNIR